MPAAETDLTQPDRPRRSPGRWLVLLLAWAVGIVVWTAYLFLIALLLVRFFA